MPSKKHKPEEIIGKLREVEIVLAQGASTAEACRRILWAFQEGEWQVVRVFFRAVRVPREFDVLGTINGPFPRTIGLRLRTNF